MREIGRAPEIVLKDAAAYLQQHGWIQGVGVGPNAGRVCLVNAIDRVCPGGREFVSAYELVEQRLGGAIPPSDSRGLNSLARWNDARGRTVEEVLSVLRGDS